MVVIKHQVNLAKIVLRSRAVAFMPPLPLTPPPLPRNNKTAMINCAVWFRSVLNKKK